MSDSKLESISCGYDFLKILLACWGRKTYSYVLVSHRLYDID